MAEPYAQSNSSGIHLGGSNGPFGTSIRGRAAIGGRTVAWIILLSGIPATLFYVYLHYSETGKFPSLERNAAGFLAGIVAGLIVGSALYGLNKVLDRWMPWANFFSSRFLVGYTTNVGLSILVISLVSALIGITGAPVFQDGLNLNDADLTWKVIILLLVFVFIYNVIYALLYAYQHYAFAQLDQLRSERQQLELQFEALKSQISPHYLFNSLNTISSLLFRDLQSAEQFIRRLVQTYQYILATRNKKFVLLSEELEFVQSYYYLLRIRFQQQLSVEINVPLNMMNTRIPPLTLQMLVENAVKHNTISPDNQLLIYISAQDNTYVSVVNTRTGRAFEVDSFKVGLENIRQRYRYFTDRQIVVKNDERFMVSLPVLHAMQEKAERKHSA